MPNTFTHLFTSKFLAIVATKESSKEQQNNFKKGGWETLPLNVRMTSNESC